MRSTDNIYLYGMICAALGHAGGLFSVPTLIAHALQEDQRAEFAQLALAALKNRINKNDADELKDFFTPGYWRPKWMASKEKFITYVACLYSLVTNGQPFDGGVMDELGERLIKEIEIDILPYHTFRELRLCTPEWDAEEDIARIRSEVDHDMIISEAIAGVAITKNPDSHYKENLANMKCDYLIARLQLDVEYGQLQYTLRAANVLNEP